MTEHKYGFLIDPSRCIDCRSCLVACSVENKVSMKHTRIWMRDTGIQGEFPNLKRYTAPYHCMHCIDPSCVSACTVGALKLSEDGIVTYDKDRCIGCRYCMYACPFEVPHFEWEQQLAFIVKCDFCEARLEAGFTEPACAATCPTDAILFGEREEMLKLAHEKIEKEPERYINHVFGEHENGGTCTFYISPVPYEQLDMPVTEQTESPAHINREVTEIGTPVIATAVALGMTGIYLALKPRKGNRAAKDEPEAEVEKPVEKEE